MSQPQEKIAEDQQDLNKQLTTNFNKHSNVEMDHLTSSSDANKELNNLNDSSDLTAIRVDAIDYSNGHCPLNDDTSSTQPSLSELVEERTSPRQIFVPIRDHVTHNNTAAADDPTKEATTAAAGQDSCTNSLETILGDLSETIKQDNSQMPIELTDFSCPLLKPATCNFEVNQETTTIGVKQHDSISLKLGAPPETACEPLTISCRTNIDLSSGANNADDVIQHHHDNESVTVCNSLTTNTILSTDSRSSSGNHDDDDHDDQELDQEQARVNRLKSRRFQIGWCDFTYKVGPSWYENPKWGKINSMFHKETRLIIKGISGGLSCGQMVALMGPSGAGKTCLLECISGARKDGLGGSIWLRGRKKVKMAIVSQYDFFLPQFTVREIILYASKMKNPVRHNHQQAVDDVIKQLGLNVCEFNNIMRCSGGQQKRVAIAQEIISKPNILILDEPTSGLDSSCCYQTMKVMRDVLDLSMETEEPMAVVCTIHQPSAKVFDLFNMVYLLGKSGLTAYFGPPAELVATISRVTGMECPQYSNPADFMIELVALDYGEQVAERLVENERGKALVWVQEHPVPDEQDSGGGEGDCDTGDTVLLPLHKAASTSHIHHPIFWHLWLHSHRSFVQSIRDPILNNLRALIHFIFAILITVLYGKDTGKPRGCPPVIGLPTQITDPNNEDLVDLADNISYLNMSMLMVTYLAMMATILTFPLDIKTIGREFRNGWYNTKTYFLGKSLSDLPFVTLYPMLYCAIIWYGGGQDTDDWWRFVTFLLLNIVNALNSQNLGLILGSVFMNSISAATLMGPCLTIPYYLFVGFTKRINRLQKPLQTCSKGLFTRYIFEGMLSSVYGHDKCDCNNFLEQYQELRQQELARLAEIASEGSTGSQLDYYDTLIDVNTTQIVIQQQNDMMSLAADETVLSARASSFFTFGLDFEPACPKNYKPYIIQDFDLDNDTLWKGLVVSTLMFLTTRVLTYIIVAYKIRTQ